MIGHVNAPDRVNRVHRVPYLRRRLLLPIAGLCTAALLAGCGAHRRTVRVPLPDPGSSPFQSYCAACHQYDGQGMGSAPPLVSPWVTGPQERLIKLVLYGVRGRMEVAGVVYDQEMPGFAPVLSDPEAAALLTYVRRIFGGVEEPVTPEAVARVRAAHADRSDYWSVEELLEQP